MLSFTFEYIDRSNNYGKTALLQIYRHRKEAINDDDDDDDVVPWSAISVGYCLDAWSTASPSSSSSLELRDCVHTTLDLQRQCSQLDQHGSGNGNDDHNKWDKA